MYELSSHQAQLVAAGPIALKGGALGRKLPRTISSDEARALLEQPNVGCPTGLRDRCIMELMYRAGLRVSEAIGVYLRDYRPADSQLHIRPEVAKGAREAYVYLEAETCRLLDIWIKVYRRKHAHGSPLLFTTLKGGQLDRGHMWEMVARRAKRAGIERHVHPHVLRHSYATELLREGFNLREVQLLMRHSDVRTTTIYTHVYDDELARKVQARNRHAG